MKCILASGQVIQERIPEEGGPDENGEGGYYQSLQANFSPQAFARIDNYQLSPALQQKVLNKAQHYFGFSSDTEALPGI